MDGQREQTGGRTSVYGNKDQMSGQVQIRELANLLEKLEIKGTVVPQKEAKT